jgi:hypothetical protein
MGYLHFISHMRYHTSTNAYEPSRSMKQLSVLPMWLLQPALLALKKPKTKPRSL